MEKEGAQTVQIVNSDDKINKINKNKRQLTAVLALIAAGDYLPPQLLYQVIKSPWIISGWQTLEKRGE